MVATLSDRKFSLLAWDIPAEQEEPWRRFLQEISESRYQEYAESRRHLGISAECLWLAPKSSGGGIAVVFLEAEDPERALRELGASKFPFDSWYRMEMRKLFGCDFPRLVRVTSSGPLFAWREGSGEGEQEPPEGS